MKLLASIFIAFAFGYAEYVASAEKTFRDQLAQEKAGRQDSVKGSLRNAHIMLDA